MRTEKAPAPAEDKGEIGSTAGITPQACDPMSEVVNPLSFAPGCVRRSTSAQALVGYAWPGAGGSRTHPTPHLDLLPRLLQGRTSDEGSVRYKAARAQGDTSRNDAGKSLAPGLTTSQFALVSDG